MGIHNSKGDNFYDLGRIAWLWMNSNFHEDWSTRLMMRNIVPPISCGQYRIITENGIPVAYASWAFFSAEAEKRYIINPSKIDILDWKSGTRMWFIDFISPFSARHTFRLKSELRELFRDRYARAFSTSRYSTKGRIITYYGKEAPNGWRKQADADILSHFAGTVCPE